ncbi:MAG: hypothetical protein GY769_07900 [bacterium]|nr:hypothetical protein [bacterium]
MAKTIGNSGTSSNSLHHDLMEARKSRREQRRIRATNFHTKARELSVMADEIKDGLDETRDHAVAWDSVAQLEAVRVDLANALAKLDAINGNS